MCVLVVVLPFVWPVGVLLLVSVLVVNNHHTAGALSALANAILRGLLDGVDDAPLVE